MNYRKTHEAPKLMLEQGTELERLVDRTTRKIAALVGATLGPGGQPVLLERADDLPPVLTKDGVTVFKSLGFPNTLQQVILETFRQAAVRTANEAGDGTTSATILGDEIGRRTRAFCKANPGYSPHRVIRELDAAFRDTVEPLLRRAAVRPLLGDEAGDAILRQVALISANGEAALADAVMRCFEVTGDEGNVTLIEAQGRTGYEVEEVRGYPIPTGYEEAAGPFYTKFLRQPAQHRTVMRRPLWVLYYGRVTEWAKIERIFEALMAREGVWGRAGEERDVILVATGFSEVVVGNLALNFRASPTDQDGQPIRITRVLPMRAPRGLEGAERAFLDDLASVVGASVYDDVERPLTEVTFEGLGGESEVIPTETGPTLTWRGRTEALEVYRTRAFVIGQATPELIELRTAELQAALGSAQSKLETSHLVERIARLGGGIARLTVYGPTVSETQERRDRADDAISAVRGALREGALYGGAWGLIKAAQAVSNDAPEGQGEGVLGEVLAEGLLQPFHRLLANVGILQAEREGILDRILESKEPLVYDALHLELVDPREKGIYDSVPAVVEALRSALSIVGALGTLGGIVAHARDGDLERSEAAALAAHEREVAAGHYNVADHEDGALLPLQEEA